MSAEGLFPRQDGNGDISAIQMNQSNIFPDPLPPDFELGLNNLKAGAVEEKAQLVRVTLPQSSTTVTPSKKSEMLSGIMSDQSSAEILNESAAHVFMQQLDLSPESTILQTFQQLAKGGYLTAETKEIIKEQGSKLEQIESDYQRFEEVSCSKNREVAREFSQVTIDAKINCFFTQDDPLFEIHEPQELGSSKEQEVAIQQNSSTLNEAGKPAYQCATCCASFSSSKKLKMCHFCKLGNCSACLPKTKPYMIQIWSEKPASQSKRGTACRSCFKKYLYRDAIREAATQLCQADPQSKEILRLIGMIDKDFTRVVDCLVKINLIQAKTHKTAKEELHVLAATHSQISETYSSLRVAREEANERLREEEAAAAKLNEKKEDTDRELEGLSDQINKFYNQFETLQEEKLGLEDKLAALELQRQETLRRKEEKRRLQLEKKLKREEKLAAKALKKEQRKNRMSLRGYFGGKPKEEKPIELIAVKALCKVIELESEDFETEFEFPEEEPEEPIVEEEVIQEPSEEQEDSPVSEEPEADKPEEEKQSEEPSIDISEQDKSEPRTPPRVSSPKVSSPSHSSKGEQGFEEGDDEDEEEKEQVLALPKEADYSRKGSFYPYQREYSVAGNYEEIEELARKQKEEAPVEEPKKTKGFTSKINIPTNSNPADPEESQRRVAELKKRLAATSSLSVGTAYSFKNKMSAGKASAEKGEPSGETSPPKSMLAEFKQGFEQPLRKDGISIHDKMKQKKVQKNSQKKGLW